jgi:hypothetical protein
MAQSVSDGSGGFETDSSKEEAGHGGPGGERASRRTDRRAEKDKASRRESLVFCVVIPDLQQSVSIHFCLIKLFFLSYCRNMLSKSSSNSKHKHFSLSICVVITDRQQSMSISN